MNPHVVLATVRERLGHPIRLGTLLGLALMPVAIALAESDPSRGAPFFHAVLALTIGSGVLGQEITAGTLGIVFTRPVGRRTYALSKWGAIAGLSTLASLLQLAAVSAVLSVRLHNVSATSVAFEAVERVLVACGVSALLLLLSAAGSGLSDLAVWGLATAAAQVVRAIGMLNGAPSWTRLGEGLQFLLAPGHHLADAWKEHLVVPWGSFALALAISGAAVALAAFVLERREISYAQARA